MICHRGAYSQKDYKTRNRRGKSRKPSAQTTRRMPPRRMTCNLSSKLLSRHRCPHGRENVRAGKGVNSSTYLERYKCLPPCRLEQTIWLMVRAFSTVTALHELTVGKAEANVSVMICPDALHVNTSICPGVSINTYLR